MATMRPEPRPAHHQATGMVLAAALSAVSFAVQAQTRLQPTVDAEAVFTSNGNVNGIGPKQRDTVLTVSPGLNVNVVGANSSLIGQWQFKATHSFQGLQPDSVIPSGNLKLHTDVNRSGAGLDASLGSAQVASTLATSNAGTVSVSNQYTNTEWRLSPYFTRALDERTVLSARLTRGLQQTSQVDNTLASRPDAHLRDDSISLTQQPAPLGYAVSRAWQSTRSAGQADPVLSTDSSKAIVRYALNTELVLGVQTGVERIQAYPTRFVDHPTGLLLDWHPSERSSIASGLQQREFGRAWQLAIHHRTPWMAASIQADRGPTTSLFTIGSVGSGGSARDLFDAMLTTRIPDAQDRAAAVDSLLTSRNISTQLSGSRDFYSLTAQLRQTVNGRFVLMGRRDTWLNQAGLIKTSPLDTGTSSDLLSLTDPRHTRQYYVESQLTHQLTPVSSLTGGLRWTRAREQVPGNDPSVSRDFTWRVSLSTNMARDTTATIGLRRVLKHSAASSSSDEAALFMGLGHRF
jgi:uncharacterized protein (PEP-CTERM system associated)